MIVAGCRQAVWRNLVLVRKPLVDRLELLTGGLDLIDLIAEAFP